MSKADGINAFMVGDIKVTMIGDGFMPATSDILPTVDEDQFQAALKDAGLPAGTYPNAINAFVLEIGGAVHLIDAGGAGMMPSVGLLAERLPQAGYSADQVKSLIVTHLHPDHILGATNDDGAAFPNAEMIVSEADHAFWTNPDIKAGAPDEAKMYFDMAVGAVNAYGDRLRLFSGDADVMTGVTAVPLPGHTPGHCGMAISSNGEDLLIWSDIVHMQYLQFADPDVTVAFDIDPDAAAATRKKIFDQVATDRLRIAGMHLQYPGVGYVEKAGSGGYRLVHD